MNFRVANLYLSLIEQQGQYALEGAHRLLAAVGEDRPVRQISDVELWHGAQQMLVGAANVAQALWTSGGKRASERAPLRKALEVAEDSPLKSTAVRNDWEHMDERIERWAQSGAPIYMDGNVGNVTPEGIAPEWMFRSYNTATGELTFWSNALSVPAVTAELERITPQAGELFRRGRQSGPVA